MKIDPCTLSARELLCTESIYIQRCIDYVDIDTRSHTGADLVNCVLYTTAVARLPLRYLGFLVIIIIVIIIIIINNIFIIKAGVPRVQGYMIWV